MKITPIKITADKQIFEPGTGRVNKQEVYPCSESLLHKLHIKETDINKLQTIRYKKLNVLDYMADLDSLRDYQKEDVVFLAARKCAACFNEQRTGKTPTSLVTMRIKNVTKLLIIAPASTLYTWAEECKRWWFKDKPVYIVDGNANKRKQIIDNWKDGALIINYECLRCAQHCKRDTQGNIVSFEITGDLKYIKQHKDIQGVILDEAHRIKNHKSSQAEALFSLINIENKIALTGTPAPGKQHEIYSILHWLYPDIFSSYWRFIDYYFKQYEEYNKDRKYKKIGTFKPYKDIELQEFLKAISTRRLRASVMQWLPEKDYQTIKLELTSEQNRYIQELNDLFEIEGTEVNAINVLSKLTKIRQILLAPKLLDLKGSSPKVDWIKQYLKDYPDKQVIIFSNFTQWLKLLGQELKCNNFIIGETSKEERTKLKEQFQTGKIKLLLLNIKAAKEGITLDNADVAIFTDKYPPIGDIQQAEDRFIATTKDKINTGHTIIDLVMKNSYEENILALLKNNAAEVDIINNYIKYIKQKGGDTNA